MVGAGSCQHLSITAQCRLLSVSRSGYLLRARGGKCRDAGADGADRSGSFMDCTHGTAADRWRGICNTLAMLLGAVGASDG